MMRPIISRFLHSGDVDREGSGALGEPVWGPTAWLADLELRLGLPPVDTSIAERTQIYASRLAAVLPSKPFYARSFALDSHGTATTLLAWRDELVEAGWNGDPIANGGPRVDALVAAESAAERTLPHGFADRIARVELELGNVGDRVYDSIRMLEPREVWPEGWRRIMDLLAGAGCNFEFVKQPPLGAVGDSDLSRTQRLLSVSGHRSEHCSWTGDCSLLFARAPTSWELGEVVAGLLRALPSRDAIVVRQGDAAPLDAAFQLQGLPAQGHAAKSPLRSPLQILPLALSLLFAPRDPYRALELLTLPQGPFGGYAATELAKALGRAPGIGSREWVSAKDRLSKPRDPSDPTQVEAAANSRAKIEAWFERTAFDRTSGAPRTSVLEVIAQVHAWALRRPHLEGGTNWAVLAQSASELEKLVTAHPRPTLLPYELDQLAARALGNGMLHAVAIEQAGRIAHVASPYAVRHQHDIVVVWQAGPTESAVPHLAPWRATELRAFEAAGLGFADVDLAMTLESEAWRRVFASARRTFIVATPDTHLSAAQATIPVWDEIVARAGAKPPHTQLVTVAAPDLLARAGACAPLQVDIAAPLQPLALPEPRPAWHAEPEIVRAALGAIRRLYPTSLDSLLACPLRWVLETVLRIKPSRVTSVPDKSQLYGTLGHRLAEELHARGVLDIPTEVTFNVEAVLDELIAREGGPLLMPGMSAERAQTRQKLMRAMKVLSEVIADSDMTVTGVEIETIAQWGDRELGGRMDLLLRHGSGSEAILDLKWSDSHYRHALEHGLALQLAVYAETRRRETGAATQPHAGYFGLKNARGLSLDGSPFKSTRAFDGDSFENTWARAERTVGVALAALAEGVVPASATADPKADFIAHHQLQTDGAPQYDQKADSACKYCQNGTLCGRSWQGVT